MLIKSVDFKKEHEYYCPKKKEHEYWKYFYMCVQATHG